MQQPLQDDEQWIHKRREHISLVTRESTSSNPVAPYPPRRLAVDGN